MTSASAYLDVLGERIAEAEELAARTKKASVLVLQQFPVAESSDPLVPPVRESIANVLAFVELGTAAQARQVLDRARDFDVVALDCDYKLPESRAIIEVVQQQAPPDRLLRYSDNQVWFDSALDMVQRLQRGVAGRGGVVCGTGFLADQLRYVLPRLGAQLRQADDTEAVRDVDFVLGGSQKQACVDAALLELVPSHAAVYDLGIGSLSAAAAARARARGLRAYRLDNRAGISSAVVRLLETDHMVRRLMGHIQVRGIDIVAGGVLAPEGAVVVDDITSPSVVFGVSDGAGRFRAPLTADDLARMAFVRSLMVKVP